MMDDQKILDNAPEGATHYVLENGTSFHFKIDDKDASIYTDEWDCYTNHKDVIPDLVGLRSLADIKELVELRNEKAELVSRIAKAELAFAIVEGRNAEIEKEREWIDVTKELPKITMSVLVTDGLKVGELTYVKYVNGTGKWAGNNEHITGWMLKPKSPRALKDLKS